MKRFFFFFLFLCLFFAGFVYVSVRYVADDLLQTSVEVLAEQHLSRKLVFHEGMSLTFLPFAIEAHNVSLMNEASFDNSPMLEVGHLVIRLKLLPFIQQRKVIIERIMLDGVDVRLSRLADGRHNWRFGEDVPVSASAKLSVQSDPVAKDDLQAQPISVAINKFIIKNGKIKYRDDMSSHSFDANNIQFSGVLQSIDKALFSVSSQLFYNGQTYPVSFEGGLDIQQNKDIAFKDLKLSVRGNVINAPMVSMSFVGPRPAIRADISSKAFDFDAVFAGVNEGEGVSRGVVQSTKKQEPSSFVWSNQPIDFSFLKMVDLDINLSLARAVFKQIALESLSAKIILNDKIRSIKTEDFTIAGGAAKMLLDLTNVSHNNISTKFVYWLNDVELSYFSHFLKDVSLQGLFNARGEVKFSGGSVKRFVEQLGGNGVFSLPSTVITGVDGLKFFENYVGKRDFIVNNKSTKVSNLSASYSIQKGVLANKDLKMTLGVMNVKGEGRIDLPKLMLNYRLTPGITVSGENGDKRSLYIPVDIVGPFSDLTYRPVVSKLLPNTAVKENIQKIIENPQDVKKTLRELRKGFKEDRKLIGDSLEAIGKGVIQGNEDLKNLEQLLKGF